MPMFTNRVSAIIAVVRNGYRVKRIGNGFMAIDSNCHIFNLVSWNGRYMWRIESNSTLGVK